MASKFFPVAEIEGGPEYPLCEIDYFRRLNLLCHQCGGALRASYITALDRKYHIEHFTCSMCPTVFGAQDSYYEHEDQVYCHYHYSTQFAQRCTGCRTAILKQFVEIFRNGENQHWHPECYMIHKFWNVRLAQAGSETAVKPPRDENPTEEKRLVVRVDEDQMEDKVYRIWSVLSTFEESSAACISDMLLHVSNGAYVDGVLVAKRFIWHVDILFGATDRLDALIASHNKTKGKQAMRSPPFVWHADGSRSFQRSRGKVTLQENRCFLLTVNENSGNWSEKAWCHPRAIIVGYRSCTLSQTAHSYQLARRIEARTGMAKCQRSSWLPRGVG